MKKFKYKIFATIILFSMLINLFSGFIYANNYIVGDTKREWNRFESGLDGEKTNFDLYMEKIKTGTDEILSELKARINGDS